MKLSQNLNLLWFYRSVSTFSSNPYFCIEDIDITSTSNIWQLNFYYTGFTTFQSSVYQISKTDGAIVNEAKWYNSLPITNGGSIVLNDDQSKWYSATYITLNYVSIQVGQTSNNVL